MKRFDEGGFVGPLLEVAVTFSSVRDRVVIVVPLGLALAFFNLFIRERRPGVFVFGWQKIVDVVSANSHW